MFRMTRQRSVILEELRKAECHPTADEVYEMVRQRLPRISLGTVYRNLELLSRQCLIQKIELGGAQRRFDGHLVSHYHVRCTCCGRVDDIASEPAIKIDEALGTMSDYEIIGHRMEFMGICPHCRGSGNYVTKEPGVREKGR